MTGNGDESVGGNVPEELREVLDGMRQRYREVPPPAPGAAVSAFLDVGPVQRADGPATAAGGGPAARPTRGRRAVASITAFIGTALGKVVLGATVAAASVGAGQAAGVIHVVPHHDRPATVVHTTDEPAVHPSTTEVREVETESTEPEVTEPPTTEPPPATEPPTTVVVVAPPVPVVSGHDDQGDDHQGDDHEVDDHQTDTGDHHGDEADDDGDDVGHDQGDEVDQPESDDDGGQHHHGDHHDGVDHRGSED